MKTLRETMWMGMSATVVMMVVVLMMAGHCWGQRGRARDEASEAAETTIAMAQDILTNNFMADKPLKQLDIEAIQTALQETRAVNFYKTFEAEAQGHYYLIYSLLAHYSGDQEGALQQVRFAMRAAPNSGTISDTAIALGLLYGDYELAKTALESRQGGKGALQITDEQALLAAAQAKLAAAQGQDPNAMRAGGGADPNRSMPSAAVEKKKEESKPAKPQSRFSKYGTPQGEIEQERPTPPSRGMPPGMQEGGPGGRGEGPMMGPGMGMGPMAPADPTMMPGISGPGRASGSGGRRRPGRGGTEESAGATIDFSESVLELPVGYMPFKHLGEKIGTVKMGTVNGSYFQYEGGKGQLLAAFLWVLPDDLTVLTEADRSRSKKSIKTQMYYDPMMGGGMGMMDGGTSRSNDEEGDGIWSMGVTTDLSGAMEQYRQLYLMGSQTGVVRFVGMNQDSLLKRGELLALTAELPMPWATCMVEEGFNGETWPLEDKYSPVVMVVDTEGVICYMGPAGGFLPRQLLKREMDKAMPAGLMGDVDVPEQASGGGLLGMAAKLFGGTKKNGGDSGNAGAADAVVEAGDENATATVNEGMPKAKESNLQAANMLKGAQAMRRLNPRRACSICDDVIERYPESLEADEARLMIEGILAGNERLRKERSKAGLYTGD